MKLQALLLTLLTIASPALCMEKGNSNSNDNNDNNNNNNNSTNAHTLGGIAAPKTVTELRARRLRTLQSEFSPLPSPDWAMLEAMKYALQAVAHDSDYNYGKIREFVQSLMASSHKFYTLTGEKSFQDVLVDLIEACAQRMPNEGNMPLFAVAWKNGIHHPDIIDRAIGRDPNFLTKEWNEWKFYEHTALMFAAKYDATSVAKRLITRGANVNAQSTFSKSTALIIATANDATDTVQLLLDNSANVNVQDISYDTALICIAKNNGPITIVRLLIEKSADVDAQNYDGMTPLMYAAESNATDIAQLLIENGANVNAQNEYAQTALTFAESTKMKNLLIQHGAK